MWFHMEVPCHSWSQVCEICFTDFQNLISKFYIFRSYFLLRLKRVHQNCDQKIPSISSSNYRDASNFASYLSCFVKCSSDSLDSVCLHRFIYVFIEEMWNEGLSINCKIASYPKVTSFVQETLYHSKIPKSNNI